MSCLGTPFHHQGRRAGIGLDCIGLIVHAMQAAGLEVRDCIDYGRRPEGERLLQALAAHGFYKAETIEAGDVLIFRIGREPQHAGLALDAARMIHAYTPIGRVVETGLGETWQRRLTGIYRRNG